jgi:cation-transporting ATPase E
MQTRGHTVAMTGDGVNDILAMRQADCAIAIAGGAQAASQIAQLVLLSGDFAAIPDIVAEGRRVINNIQRAGALFLVKNILSFGLAILNLLLGLPYPFAPIHLTVISVLTIGTPSFFLALEPNYSLVRGKFLPSVLRQALPGGLTNVVAVLLAQLCAVAFTLPMTDIHTVCTAILGVVGMSVLYRVCRPFDTFRKLLWGAMGLGLVGCFLVLGKPFGFAITTPLSFVLLGAMGLVALGVFAAVLALFRRLDSLRR